MFSSLFGGGDNPYEEALDLYSYADMEAMLQEYYGPWREAGLRALPTMEEQMMMLLYSPDVIHQMMGSTYEASPGYEYQMQQSMNAANQAAAAGGMLGTPSHQTQAMEVSQGIANQDYWDYVNHLTKLYMEGLGIGGDISQQGYNASSAMASDLARFMGAQMGLTAQAGAYDASQTNAMLSGLTGMLTMIGGMYGGPAGAAAGSATGSAIGGAM
jgi:hypothetical protein